jgi:nucleoside phosphorylase
MSSCSSAIWTAAAKKVGLQRLCSHYRNGHVLASPHPVKVVLLGLLTDESEKVRRWALNGLALMGNQRDAEPILAAISRYRAEPDVLAAGIAALAAILEPEKLTTMMLRNDLPLEGGLLLAAAQRTDLFDNQLRSNRVNIDLATPVDLRMAELLVGLGRAPENLFSARHPNSTIIGELNTHDDALVAQYSVWATVENPLLSFAHLRLALKNIESQPKNVRGWVYRLISSDSATAEDHQDLLQAGARDSSEEAREGLAAGLKDTWYEGIENFVVKWALKEENESTRQRLLEHMAAHNERSARYREVVLSAYESAARDSLTRARLGAAAKQTSLYRGMKLIEHDSDHRDLFAENSPASAVSETRENVGMPAVAEKVSNPPTPDEVRVLIFTALPKEFAAVLAAVDRHERLGVKGDPNVYAIATIEVGGAGRHVIVGQSGMGKANASAAAVNALRSFPHVEHLVMVGIAGGCPNPDDPPEHVRLGDIVFSSEKGVLEYDFVKEVRGNRTIRSAPQRPSKKLLGIANDIIGRGLLGERPWEENITLALRQLADFKRPDDSEDVLRNSKGGQLQHPVDAARRADWPRVHGGAIGTADTLQKDPRMRDHLRDTYGVRAIEMEGSGMQSASWAADLDIFVIRGVCDYCDEYKNDAWQGYAAVVAAAFTRTLVQAMPAAWLE